MRLFTAIRFPEEVLDPIVKLIDEARLIDPDARFVRKDQLHLTLDFIGEVPSADASEEALRAACERWRACGEGSFQLSFSDLGTFRGKGGAIFWLGLAPNDSLMRFEAILREELTKRKLLSDSRAYSPHITLARKFRATPEQIAALNAKKPQIPDMTVSAATLVLSHRVDGMLTYDNLISCPLD